MALGLGKFASPVPVMALLCLVPIWEFAMSGELVDAASPQGTPLPLTKQKTVRCYKENVKKDDGKNYEIEKIRKDEDVIETLQQRHSRDTNCVVVTSVTDDDMLPDAKLKEYSSSDLDLPLSHDMGSSFGDGSADLSLGQDFDTPSLDSGFGTLHDTPDLQIPSIPSVGDDFGSLRDVPKLPTPGHKPTFGAGSGGGLPKIGIDSGFGNLQDINTFRSGGGGSGGDGGDGGDGDAAPVEESMKTYEFATNIKRQESYDHHGFHQERTRVAVPGGGWKTTYRYDGPGGGTYETSANDLDQKISAVNGATPVARAVMLAVLLVTPRALALLVL